MKKSFKLALALMLAFPFNLQSLKGTLVKAQEVEEVTPLSDFEIINGDTITRYNGTAKRVVIPEGIKHIQYYVENQAPKSPFADSNVEEIVLPSSMITVDEAAFIRCETLKKVFLSSNVTEIGLEAFNGCGIEEINLPDGLKEIKNQAFNNCKSLKAIVIPSSVITIGISAFYGCTSLEKTVIPGSIKTLPSSVFARCIALKEVELNEGLTEISTSVFERCTSLERLTIPKSVTTLGGLSWDNTEHITPFTNCTNLTLNVYEGSYAKQYAQEHDIPYTIVSMLSKDDIQAKINEANTYSVDNYTVTSYQALTNAVSVANETMNNAEVTQEEIAKVCNDIDNAIKALETRADMSEIRKAYDDALALDELNYTKSSYDELKICLDATKVMLEDNSDINQSQADAQLDTLNGKVESLVACANKTILQSLYDSISNLNEDNYTVSSWNNLQETKRDVSDVLVNIREYSQSIVDEKTVVLDNAIKGLVERANLTNLQALYDEKLVLNESDYSNSSWEVFNNAMIETKAMLDGDTSELTQAQADTQYDKLIEASSQLKTVDSLKNSLISLIDEKNSLNEETYTTSSWQAYVSAVNEASKIVEDENSSSQDYDTAYNNILAAKNGLETRADKTELQKVYDEAEVFDTNLGTTQSRNSLAQAMATALALLENIDATQVEVDNAKTLLENAMNNFIYCGDPSVYEDDLKAAKELDKSLLIDESKQALEQAISLAEEVKLKDEPTVEEVNEVSETLNDVLKNLVYIKADYQKINSLIQQANRLDQSKYTNYSLVLDAIKNIDFNKTVLEQEAVDQMATLLENAIHSLISNMNYQDVTTDDWFYGVVDEAYARGLMGAEVVDKNLFKPDNPITRGMVATVLYRMAGTPKVNFIDKFPDVKNGLWYSNAIIWAKSVGVVKGYDNGKYGPDDNITREQLAIMLRNYAVNVGKLKANEKADLNKFEDVKSISPYAIPSVEWAIANKIISGKDEGTKVAPIDNATRAECAKMFTTLQDLLNKK